MDDTLDEEMNVVEGTANGLDENMNNEEYAKGTGVRKKDDAKKRKFFQQYLYQQDYHEALRSLLWEPYDCRNNNNDEDESDENWCLLANKVPERKLSSSEASTVSSCSSEAIGASAFDKRISWPLVRSGSRRVRPQSSGACDLDREQMDIMVSDLRRGGKHGGRGDGACQQGALVSGGHQGIRQCVRDRAGGVQCASPLDMATPVTGTLEPPDASDSTRLVEPAAQPSSSGNVSVVNCYRAVPVAVVSSVPTIKCLNTQDNVSNVNVVNVRASRTPPAIPGTSKTRTKRPVSAMVTKPTTVLTNHNRSVSNPVLGQHPRPTPRVFGSQQNLPIRLETHFGEALEQSQTFVTNQNVIPPTEPKPRTFTSTEAQTDDIGVPLNVPLRCLANREQRRRERRERRNQRRLHQTAIWQTSVEALSGEVHGLPDLLHSHLPPYVPGAPLPPPVPTVHGPATIPVGPPSLPHLVDPALNPPPHPPGVGFPFPFTGSSRR